MFSLSPYVFQFPAARAPNRALPLMPRFSAEAAPVDVMQGSVVESFLAMAAGTKGMSSSPPALLEEAKIKALADAIK